MSGKNTSVFGIYPTYADVENGVSSLKAAGFRNTDISVLFPENQGTKDFAHDRNTRSPRFYRIANEVPTLLMIGIVILVIVRPF